MNEYSLRSGSTVGDPFLGTGTTSSVTAAMKALTDLVSDKPDIRAFMQS